MQLVKSGELAAASARVGSGYRLIEPELTPDAPALSGVFTLQSLRPGFTLHCTDIQDLHSMTTQVVLQRSVKIVLMLRGRSNVTFGERRLAIGGAQAAGAVICLNQPELFTRQAVQGNTERKVSLSLEPDWLESTGLTDDASLRRFAREHLAVANWRPSSRTLALAEQILQPAPLASGLARLQLESRALELAADALSAISGDQPAPTRLRPQDYRRVRAARELLDSDRAADWSLADIARHCGTNASTLQQHFRTAYGTTVFAYLRERKLQQARVALEGDGVTVGQAADIAGYGSAANFATAYKRRFGIAPKQSKRRV